MTTEEAIAKRTERRGETLNAQARLDLERGVPLVLPTILPGPVDWRGVFGQDATDRVLEYEVGMGRPHFLCERAAEVPDHLVIGVDWKARWAKMAHKRAAREGLPNLRAIYGNAWWLTGWLFAPSTLDRVWLNFPDPWWKAKHEKRRVINGPFAQVIADRLKPGGQFCIQTDVASLLEEELDHLERRGDLVNPHGPGRLSPVKLSQARSHREKKCDEHGVPVFRAVLEKRG